MFGWSPRDTKYKNYWLVMLEFLPYNYYRRCQQQMAQLFGEFLLNLRVSFAIDIDVCNSTYDQ